MFRPDTIFADDLATDLALIILSRYKNILWMYLGWSLCTLYLLACQVRVTVGDSGLCWCDVFRALINSLVC